MQMDRSIIHRFHGNEPLDDGYIEADRAELLAMVWDITKDAWVFVRGSDVERRLQRDVNRQRKRSFRCEIAQKKD